MSTEWSGNVSEHKAHRVWTDISSMKSTSLKAKDAHKPLQTSQLGQHPSWSGAKVSQNCYWPFYPQKITLGWEMTVHLSELVWSHWPRKQLCVRRDTALVLHTTQEGPHDRQERERETRLRADGYADNPTILVALRRQHKESGKAWCFKNKGKSPCGVLSWRPSKRLGHVSKWLGALRFSHAGSDKD